MFYIIIKTRVKASEDKILSQKYITVKYVTIKYNKIYSIKNIIKIHNKEILKSRICLAFVFSVGHLVQIRFNLKII